MQQSRPIVEVVLDASFLNDLLAGNRELSDFQVGSLMLVFALGDSSTVHDVVYRRSLVSFSRDIYTYIYIARYK